VQWWSVWYPGAEPGGGGYVAQRMLSAKNENHAVWATFAFNIMHYALRPWPWIFVALASLIVFPDIASLQKAFPHIDPSVVNDDLAYPAMLTFLPPGLIGLLLAALISAFMSTISTHLNWGSSYVVNDFYKRFLKPDASESELVLVGRISTVFLMVFAAILALQLESALQSFQILLSIGAGTGLIFILRWFWWRINAEAEIVAMFVSFAIAVWFQVGPQKAMLEWQKLLWSVGITTVAWVATALLTAPTKMETLKSFYKEIKPAGPGWEPVKQHLTVSENTPSTDNLSIGILKMLLGTILVYASLFGTGYFLYGNMIAAGVGAVVSGVCGLVIWRLK
jgi:solute:Na+ symporter, SSS family